MGSVTGGGAHAASRLGQTQTRSQGCQGLMPRARPPLWPPLTWPRGGREKGQGGLGEPGHRTAPADGLRLLPAVTATSHFPEVLPTGQQH